MNRQRLIEVRQKFQAALDPDAINDLGRQAGFVKRLRTLTPHRLTMALLCALALPKTEHLADVLRSFNALTTNSVRYKPFHNQLSKRTFPSFMREVYLFLLGKLAVRVLEPLPDSVLARFDDVIIQDGTSFAIKDALKDVFPGRFSTISPAAVELHATMSLFKDQVHRVILTPDTASERVHLPPADSLKNTIILADRGYCDICYCASVAEAEGFYLIRFLGNLNPLVRRCWSDGRRIKRFEGLLLSEIQFKLKGRSFDLDVEWVTGKYKGTRMRLVMVWNQQLRSHMVLGTNLERELFTVAVTRQLYSLRWQVELVFKTWKSYANLRKFQTSKQGIAEGMIWASLAAAALKRFFAHATQAAFDGLETSTHRVAKALRYHVFRFCRALLRGRGIARVISEILEYLSSEGARDSPRRDRMSGRMKLGLRPAIPTECPTPCRP